MQVLFEGVCRLTVNVPVNVLDRSLCLYCEGSVRENVRVADFCDSSWSSCCEYCCEYRVLR